MREMASGVIPSICSLTKADMAISGRPATESPKTPCIRKTHKLSQLADQAHVILSTDANNIC